jgi:hypothetical protein
MRFLIDFFVDFFSGVSLSDFGVFLAMLLCVLGVVYLVGFIFWLL